ncbi:hypothetical protein MTO96_008777 [Rhipicephalus appendiculatus]
MQATLEELFANLTLQRGSSERERRRCVEEEGNAPEPSVSRRRSEERIVEQARPKFSKAEQFSQTKQEGDVEQKPREAISETDAASILKQIREILQENGPTQEVDLLEALGPSQIRLIIEAHGTLTAFLDRCPGFRVVREDLYTFVYYQDPEEEDEAAGRSSFVKIGATTASCEDSSVECNGGRLQAAAGDAGPRRIRSTSSSSDSYESAVEGEEEGARKASIPIEERIQSGTLTSSPFPSRTSCQANARRRGPDAEKQRALAFDPRSQPLASVDKRSRRSLKRPQFPEFPELPGRVQRHHSGPTVDKKFRRSVKQSPEFPELQSRDARPRHRVPSVDRKSRRSLKRPPVEEFPELPGRERRRRAGPTFDKKPKRSAKQSPEQESPESPESPSRQTSASAPYPGFQSVMSSPSGYATRSRTERPVSRTARRAAQEQPNNTEQENRSRTDNSRRRQDGSSRMNFNAIVALMLGHPESTSQAKPS